MQRASELTIDKLAPKTIIIGPPLSGKSIFSATWPLGNTFVFDFDDNMASISSSDRLTKEQKSHIYYETFKDANTTKPLAYMSATKVLNELAKEPGKIQYQGVEFNHIVIDSGTTCIDIAMNHHLYVAGRVGQMPQVGSAQANDYSGANFYFKQFVFRVLALPCAVTLNCHEAMDASETEGGVRRVYPDLIGKLSTQISSRFQLALRMCTYSDPKTKEEKRRLLTRQLGMYFAAHRFSNALETYEEADWGIILEKINKHLTNINATKEEIKQ